MIYCINPECSHRKNSHQNQSCESCGTSLLIKGRYTLAHPLRTLEEQYNTEIFEVIDHKKSQQNKVLKLLKSNRPRLIEMLRRESEILQCLYHPGIPKVEWDGYFTINIPQQSAHLHCLVMEKIAGENLELCLAEHGRISRKIALNWLRQLITILEFVHKKNFFHRDIKPSNIILKPDGKLVLIDFGTARKVSETYITRIRSKLKVTGVVSGGYTAPEQLNYHAVPQSDYYALGRTFVHLMTGIHPVDLPVNPKTGQLVWEKKAPQISRPLADFINDLMATLPEKRPQNAQEILPFLTTKGLWKKSLDRVLNSRQFRLTILGVLTTSAVGLTGYRLSYPLISQRLLEKGLELHQKGDFNEAYEAYQDAKDYNPQDERIYTNIAFLCQYHGDKLEVHNPSCDMENYQKAVRINPNNPLVRYNLGDLYDQYGNTAKAQAEYEFVRNSSPDLEASALTNLARLQLLEGESNQAIRLSKEGLEKISTTTDNEDLLRSALYRNLGWAYLMKTDYIEAETYLEKALELDPERTEAYCLLAQVLEARGNNNSALVQWRNCLEGDSYNYLEIKILQTIAIQRLTAAGEINEN